MRFFSVLPFVFSLLVPVSAQPSRAVDGEWGDQFDMKVIPIHAMLLPDGQVLAYGTNDRGGQGGGLYYEVWDIRSGKHTVTGNHKLLTHSTGTNTFCSTLNMDIKTGNILIMGGDDDDNGGIPDALEFNYRTHEIRKHPKGDMKYSRWYGTSVNLPNGDIFIVGGRAGNKQVASSIPEVWNSETGFVEYPGADVPHIAIRTTQAWWYPHIYINSKGDIIAIMAKGTNTDCYRIDLDGEGKTTKIGVKPFASDKLGPSIMFDVDKVVFLDNVGLLWVADISSSDSISFTRMKGTGSARTNAVMNPLPDGRVSITGGCTHYDKQGNTLDCAVKSMLIWDPVTNGLFRGPSEDTPRLYHSSGLTLPDGTIFSAGGGAPGPLKNLNGQIYSPGYLFNKETGAPATRPVIEEAPRSIRAGSKFHIKVDSIRNLDKVTAVKAGSMTHSRNCDARWLHLNHTVIDPATGLVEVTSRDKNIMITGLWTLYTLDENGVPAHGHLMRVLP